MRHRARTALLLLLFAVHAGAERIEVYRSVDAQGNISYSDRPPAGAASELVGVDASTPPPSPEVAERRAQMSRVADELRAARAEREARATGAAGSPPYAQDPAAYGEPPPTRDNWLPIYYPYAPAHRPRPPHLWPTTPQQVPAIPRPNPDSASPRGLRERLRQAR